MQVLTTLGRGEEERLTLEVARLEEEMKLSLLPKDPADDRDVIVEKVLQELRWLVGELPAGFTTSDVVGRGSWRRGHWALRFTGPRRLARLA